jgi:hypothetical protein
MSEQNRTLSGSAGLKKKGTGRLIASVDACSETQQVSFCGSVFWLRQGAFIPDR